MNLIGKPKTYPLGRGNPEAEEIDIVLTINFNEQWQEIRGGRVKFGISSGELRLNLTHGVMPYELRGLSGDLPLNISKERQSQGSTLEKRGNQGNVGGYLRGKAEVPTIGFSMAQETTVGQSEKFNITDWQVSTKGDLTTPSWVFEVRTGSPVLKGLLSKEKLGTMELSGVQWKVEAMFVVPTLKNIQITEAEGPWLRNAPIEKRKAFELGLAKLLLKHRLTPFLSRLELSYE